MPPDTEDKTDKFEWVQIKEELGAHETATEKLKRKVKDNPLVPLGCVLTVGVLAMGLTNFAKGDRVKSQRYMRLRVLAQGFTIAALMGGMVVAARKVKPSETDVK